MTQPPKGPGALPLLLRLSMLRSRQRGAGSLAERGYSLAVALITAFVLLLGVAALASRGQLGFIGQVFQVQNREARAVAESAIAELANSLNREQNRYLLIAGTTANWGDTSLNRNICTVYDNAGQFLTNKSDEDVNDRLPVDGNLNARFALGNEVNLGNNRRFQVESIDYLREDRSVYSDGSVAFRSDLADGQGRALIRVTVIGIFQNPNGRESRARVAREFEVVPKCCKRSFGSQAGRNWGRDRESCRLEGDGGSGFIINLNGGGTGGSKANLNIRDDQDRAISEATCWNGPPPGGGDTILDSAVDTSACEDGNLFIGNPQGQGAPGTTKTSFAPDEFNLVLPQYALVNPPDPLNRDYLATELRTLDPNPIEADREFNERFVASLIPPIPHRPLTISAASYIFFNEQPVTDPSTGLPIPGLDRRGLRICNISGAGINTATCRELTYAAPGTLAAPNLDVCYERIVDDRLPSLPNPTRRPYTEVNCRLQNIDVNANLFVDTSLARINFHFDGPLPADGEYISAAGNNDLTRVHCSWGAPYAGGYTAASRCNEPLQWIAANGRDYQYQCSEGGFLCGLVNQFGNRIFPDYYDNSELLNVYATGNGSFNLRGASGVIGFNFYAPRANIDIRGGGGPNNPNFAGRLWIDNVSFFGGGQSIILRFPTSSPSFCTGDDCPPLSFSQYWDFMARSFTQSAGFGL